MLRTLAAIPFMANWFDEIWQYLEPAWHLVAGPWVQTWDYRAGLRSWLIPELLSVPMGLGHAISPDTTLHLLLARLTLAALSLVIVGAAVSLGLRLSRLHGILAGLVAATWFELVYFAPRALSEPIGLALMMGAVWILLGRARQGPRGFAIAGLLMGLCFVARIQYAPALLTLAIFTARRDWRGAWLPLIAGGCAALAIDAMANLAMGATPFRWMIEAVRINIFQGRAKDFGVMPPFWYFAQIGSYWLIAAPAVLALAWIGARRYPALLWMAIVHLGFHSLIAHKEYRFVLASTVLLVLLAAIGTADLLRRLPRRRLALATGGAALAWTASSAALAFAGPFQPNWTREADLAAALDRAGQPRDTCGLGVYFRPGDTPTVSYALYRRATPIYLVPIAAKDRHEAAYDAIVTARSNLATLPARYRLEYCAPIDSGEPGCIARRTGSCTLGPAQLEVNAVFRGTGN